MTRIISGQARGVRLAVPAAGTRPTSDRVREALFGALAASGYLDEARVLDLYAGSGALALEAMSRGAESADLVEKSRPAAAVLRKNTHEVRKALGEVDIRVHENSVSTFLTRAVRTWDLVFSDPPYDVSDQQCATDLRALAPHLSLDAVVVLERDRRSALPPLADSGLRMERERVYGDTVIWWIVPDDHPAEASQSR